MNPSLTLFGLARIWFCKVPLSTRAHAFLGAVEGAGLFSHVQLLVAAGAEADGESLVSFQEGGCLLFSARKIIEGLKNQLAAVE